MDVVVGLVVVGRGGPLADDDEETEQKHASVLGPHSGLRLLPKKFAMCTVTDPSEPHENLFFTEVGGRVWATGSSSGSTTGRS